MAARILNSLGAIGVGLAVTGGIVNSALYNGIIYIFYFQTFFCQQQQQQQNRCSDSMVDQM